MSAISGRNCVITGIIPNHSRGTASAEIQNLGGFVQSSLGPSTEVLIVGAKPGPAKLTKAASLGVEVISWEEATSNGSGTATTLAHAPTRILEAIRVVSPQLAKKNDEIPTSANWLHEVKWDGYRCIATIADGKIAMQSRSGLSEYVEQFPLVAAALVELGKDFIVDGELVVTDVHGHSSFETAHTATAGGTESYMIFDVLEFEGEDVRSLPLVARRELLAKLIPGEAPLHVSPSHDDGEWLLDWVTERGLEGVVSKQRTSRYVEGSRTEAWLKTKVRPESEFLIAGYTAGEGARAWAFGALILARYGSDGELVCAGKVGTGFDDTCLAMLRDKMAELGARELPSHFPREIIRDGIGIEPTLIAQVRYQRVTKDGSLWHPSFQRLRTDKKPEEVVVE